MGSVPSKRRLILGQTGGVSELVSGWMCLIAASARVSHRDSGYLVSVPRLLVYICPPTSMWTGAVDLVSLAGVGIPPEPRGDRQMSG